MSWKILYFLCVAYTLDQCGYTLDQGCLILAVLGMSGPYLSGWEILGVRVVRTYSNYSRLFFLRSNGINQYYSLMRLRGILLFIPCFQHQYSSRQKEYVIRSAQRCFWRWLESCSWFTVQLLISTCCKSTWHKCCRSVHWLSRGFQWKSKCWFEFIMQFIMLHRKTFLDLRQG